MLNKSNFNLFMIGVIFDHVQNVIVGVTALHCLSTRYVRMLMRSSITSRREVKTYPSLLSQPSVAPATE